MQSTSIYHAPCSCESAKCRESIWAFCSSRAQSGRGFIFRSPIVPADHHFSRANLKRERPGDAIQCRAMSKAVRLLHGVLFGHVVAGISSCRRSTLLSFCQCNPEKQPQPVSAVLQAIRTAIGWTCCRCRRAERWLTSCTATLYSLQSCHVWPERAEHTNGSQHLRGMGFTCACSCDGLTRPMPCCSVLIQVGLRNT